MTAAPNTIAERVAAAFGKNFSAGDEVGAGVAVWIAGREAAHCVAGHADPEQLSPWDHETLALVWSATKGLAAGCVLHALEDAGLAPDVKIAGFWPEFAQNGKEDIRVADVLGHRAGLAALEQRDLSLLDHEAVVRALQTQRPLWKPRAGHGYSPRTFGYLADECVRRLAGCSLGQYWRDVFGEPMHLDFWIGLPEELDPKVARMLPPRIERSDWDDPFLQALQDEESLTRAAFSSPQGLGSISQMNTLQARTASLPALGGIGTPTSMAKFYCMLACGGEWEGMRYFRPRTIEWMSTRLVNGRDKTLLMDTAFSAGFMLDPLGRDGRKSRTLFGPARDAFGHPGAGGSMAFADPERGLGFAYVMNQMEIGVMPNRRAINLVEAVYAGPGPEV